MVLKQNEFGKLSNKELNDFEMTNSIRLPYDYKHFLLKTNGGQPIKNNSKKPETVISYIFGMHNGAYFASLYKQIDTFSRRIPLGTVPIASDPFGNLFLMSFHPENCGQIFFWAHEGEPQNQDGHYVDNVSFVASSFSDFVNELF